jgi:Ni2+-binding GTPase involved in maturation of urease and hydrogenase
MDYKYIYLLLLTLLIFYIISRYFNTKETFKSTINDIESTKNIKKNDFNYIKQQYINKNKKINNINEKSTENFLESFLDVMSISNNLLNIATDTAITGTLSTTGNIKSNGNISSTVTGPNLSTISLNTPGTGYTFYAADPSYTGGGGLVPNHLQLYAYGAPVAGAINQMIDMYPAYTGRPNNTITLNADTNINNGLTVTGNVTVKGTLNVNGQNVTGGGGTTNAVSTNMGVNNWLVSTDNIARFYFANNADTYFSTNAAWRFQNQAHNADVVVIDQSGSLTMNNNLNVSGGSHNMNGTLGVGSVINVPTINVSNTLNANTVNLNGLITSSVNNWHRSSDGIVRYYFANNADTYFSTNAAWRFQNQAHNADVVIIDQSGNTSMSGNLNVGGSSNNMNGTLNIGSVINVPTINVATTLNANNVNLNGLITSSVNNWHRSSDGISRYYFANNADTYFSTNASWRFQNQARNADVVVIDQSGSLTMNNNLSVSGGSHNMNGTLGVGSVINVPTINVATTLNANNVNLNGLITSSVDKWHRSSDGISRYYFTNNADTYFSTNASWRFQNQARTADVVVIDQAGNMFMNGNLTVNGNITVTGETINSNLNIGGNLTVANVFTVTNPLLYGTTTFGVGTWHKSFDGISRFNFANNADTYFSTNAAWRFQNQARTADVVVIDQSGSLTMNNNLTVSGGSHNINGTLGVGSVINAPTINATSTLNANNVNLNGLITSSVNNWHRSSDGISRYYFANNADTCFSTNASWRFQNQARTADVVVIDQAGNLTNNGNHIVVGNLSVGGNLTVTGSLTIGGIILSNVGGVLRVTTGISANGTILNSTNSKSL